LEIGGESRGASKRTNPNLERLIRRKLNNFLKRWGMKRSVDRVKI
jgi:hypothetical protein